MSGMEKKVKKTNNRLVGHYYEQRAKKYLEAKGYTILVSNYRVRCGEIDLIARDKKYTVFIEIKYRKTIGYGSALESVTTYKQQKIIQVATYYMMCHKMIDTPVRFDVIGMTNDTITHIENAFMKG